MEIADLLDERRALRFIATRFARQLRVVLDGPPLRYTVLGWETGGPYLYVEPAGDDWNVTPTLAGAKFDALDDVLVLLAAELTL